MQYLLSRIGSKVYNLMSQRSTMMAAQDVQKTELGQFLVVEWLGCIAFFSGWFDWCVRFS